jgi:hypothetical protein
MALGEKLFNDPSLSSNGLSCASCHNDGAGYNATFANAYPHSVAMARDIFGMDSVYLDEMVQVCMVQPMAAEPLDWSGEQLAALTAYMGKVQKQLAANPCALKGGKCGACKPCAGKNPCATKIRARPKIRVQGRIPVRPVPGNDWQMPLPEVNRPVGRARLPETPGAAREGDKRQ